MLLCPIELAAMLENDEHFIKRAIELAHSSVNNGNHPFGAILVHKESILIEAENAVITEKDPTQHAELRLVSQAARQFDPILLKESTLYCSTEPCAMCSGAIYWSGIRKVVFGCTEKTLAKYAGNDFLIPCSDIFQFGKEPVEIVGPILESMAENIHSHFWTNFTQTQIDTSLVQHSLSLSPEQRIDAHESALQLVRELQKAGKEFYARESKSPA